MVAKCSCAGGELDGSDSSPLLKSTRLERFSINFNELYHIVKAQHILESLHLVKALHLVEALHLVKALHLAKELHLVGILHLDIVESLFTSFRYSIKASQSPRQGH